MKHDSRPRVPLWPLAALLCLLLPAAARAAWRAAGDVRGVERRMDGVVLTLTIVPYAAAVQVSTVREDAGEGTYAEGFSSVTVVHGTGGGIRISHSGLNPARAPAFVEIISPSGQPKLASVVALLGEDNKARSVSQEEKRAVENGSYDPATKRLTFPLPAGVRNGSVTLSVLY